MTKSRMQRFQSPHDLIEFEIELTGWSCLFRFGAEQKSTTRKKKSRTEENKLTEENRSRILISL